MKKGCLILVVVSVGLFLFGCLSLVCCDDDPKDRIISACEENDYEKAHQLLNSNSVDFWYGENPTDLKKYVFEKETDYLLDLNDETASKRIIILIKDIVGTNSLDGEDNNYLKQSCASLMAKAIIMKNSFLIKELVKTDDFFFKESIRYLCEEGIDDDLTFAKDIVIKRANNIDFACNSTDMDKTKFGYNEVFYASIKSGNFAIAKELIDHLDFLRETSINNLSNELKDKAVQYINALQKAYSYALKSR